MCEWVGGWVCRVVALLFRQGKAGQGVACGTVGVESDYCPALGRCIALHCIALQLRLRLRLRWMEALRLIWGWVGLDWTGMIASRHVVLFPLLFLCG